MVSLTFSFILAILIFMWSNLSVFLKLLICFVLVLARSNSGLKYARQVLYHWAFTLGHHFWILFYNQKGLLSRHLEDIFLKIFMVSFNEFRTADVHSCIPPFPLVCILLCLLFLFLSFSLLMMGATGDRGNLFAYYSVSGFLLLWSHCQYTPW